MKYEEASSKLKILEDDIENLEHEAEGLEIKNNELSSESKLMSSTLKSFQAMECSMTDKEAKSGDEIGSITASLEKSLAECGEMVEKRDKLMAMVDELDLMLSEATASKQAAIDSLDS